MTNPEVFIFAGGKSSRMGTDKGLVMYNGAPMISKVAATAANTGLSVTIIASNPAYDCFGLPRVEDLACGEGPVMGLITALQYATAAAVIIVSCDMPAIETDVLRMVAKADTRFELVVAGNENGSQQFPARYAKLLLPQIQSLFKIGIRSLRELNDRLICKKIALGIDEIFPESFININTPQELCKYRQIA